MPFTFFVLGTACTKLGYAKKAALGIAQEKGGRRSAKHALASTSAGLAFAFLAMATGWPEGFALALDLDVDAAGIDRAVSAFRSFFPQMRKMGSVPAA